LSVSRFLAVHAWRLAFLGSLFFIPLSDRSDPFLVDIYFRLRGPRNPSPDIIILDIDYDSTNLQQLLDPEEIASSDVLSQMASWPWRRSLQATLAKHVLESGAERIVFTILYPRASSYGLQDDKRFIETLKPYADRISLPIDLQVQDDPRTGLELIKLIPPIYPFASLGLDFLLSGYQGGLNQIPGQKWLREHLSDLSDGIAPPLPFSALAQKVPQNNTYIDFLGPSGTLNIVPAWQLYDKPTSFWRGKTVIFGRTPSVSQDQKITPFGPISSIELQATAIATVLQNTGVRSPSFCLNAVASFLWLLICYFLFSSQKRSLQTLYLTLLLVFVGFSCLFFAWLQGVLLLMSPFVLTPLFAGLTLFLKTGIQEYSQQRFLRILLEKRISTSLLSDLLTDPGPLATQLYGERARCALLFTDLFDFTPLTSQLGPAEVFTLLNRYFDAISACVLEEHGFLDKFIGDSLMAEFGVPRTRGDAVEALAAISAALAMRDRLDALNHDLILSGLAPLQHGIGIHFGDVMAGNLGGRQRMEYTVVGESVNIANRLERLSRTYNDTPIILSDSIVQLLPGRLDLVCLGPQKLRGVSAPISAYGLLGIL